ncbi:hypothetical protein CBER1_02782 [Cercospora berteroae]|uniref:SnoaL-like domain-containing protein n=1 Tax=Cercospora berteroae TaxID=357750 RepID=A0A2S6CBX0_9PEZI|nr:hypothetical protein CBER1_02782 [Cercospora berteroae]
MPLKALAIPLPITPEVVQSHPALQFYAIYGRKFPTTDSQWQTQDFEEFYSSDCKTLLPNNKILSTGEAGWEHFRRLYSTFPKVERELRSGIVVYSDDEDKGKWKGKYEIHVEFITKLYTTADDEKDGGGVVELPQSFVYVLGKADEGKGTLGLQIRELRNYYDLRTLEEALGEKI